VAVSENEWRRRTDQLWRGVEHAARVGASRIEVGSNIAAVVTTRLDLADGAVVPTVMNRQITITFNTRLPADTIQAVMG
jgi:hypothetical protein